MRDPGARGEAGCGEENFPEEAGGRKLLAEPLQDVQKAERFAGASHGDIEKTAFLFDGFGEERFFVRNDGLVAVADEDMVELQSLGGVKCHEGDAVGVGEVLIAAVGGLAMFLLSESQKLRDGPEGTRGFRKLRQSLQGILPAGALLRNVAVITDDIADVMDGRVRIHPGQHGKVIEKAVNVHGQIPFAVLLRLRADGGKINLLRREIAPLKVPLRLVGDGEHGGPGSVAAGGTKVGEDHANLRVVVEAGKEAPDIVRNLRLPEGDA